MRKQLISLATLGLLASGLDARGTLAGHPALAAARAEGRALASATAVAGTPSPPASPSTQPSGTPSAGGSPTPTGTPSPAGSPTPGGKPATKASNALRPVMVVVGTKVVGSGQQERAAFLLANNPKNLISFLIAPPVYVPKDYRLLQITVVPAQDQQTPAAASLQYIPKTITTMQRTFPSFALYKQLGLPIRLINPGGKVQSVIIRAGKKGAGVVRGQLADIKLKGASEQVQISWVDAGVNFELTSVTSLSKLSVPDLLKVASGFQ